MSSPVYICVDYFNAQLTIKAVTSFLDGSATGSCVIVDNSCDDAEFNQLKIFFGLNERVDIIRAESNLGYFRGLNLGLEYLYRNQVQASYIVVGNNDIIFTKDFFSAVRHNLDLFSEYPVVCPNVIESSGRHKNPHLVSDIGFLKLLALSLYFINFYVYRTFRALKLLMPSGENAHESKFHTDCDLIQGHGSCYILSHIFIQKFRYLPSNTFMYGEEYFLSKIIHGRGYRMRYLSTAIVEHTASQTVSSIPKRSHFRMQRSALYSEVYDRLSSFWSKRVK